MAAVPARTTLLTHAKQVAPHDTLSRYYDQESGRRRFLDGIFNRTAVHYDRIDRLMSLGTGPWYRRMALRRAGLAPGMYHLDVAIGTGLIAQPATRIVGSGGQVIGLDPSEGMLAAARRKMPVTVLRGIAERLPFTGRSFDFLSMGYALRHVADLGATFAEYRRVLRPGGRLLILEFVQPKSRIGNFLARFYFQRAVPWASYLGSRDREMHRLMKYCADTVEACVPAGVILKAMHDAGFTDIEQIRFGLVCEYRGRRPQAN
jgi:demethylmenaquinone methyltransferase/2-methoxy-6-polyprenyl-1,4-benzoquinol methylase